MQAKNNRDYTKLDQVNYDEHDEHDEYDEYYEYESQYAERGGSSGSFAMFVVVIATLFSIGLQAAARMGLLQHEMIRMLFTIPTIVFFIAFILSLFALSSPGKNRTWAIAAAAISGYVMIRFAASFLINNLLNFVY